MTDARVPALEVHDLAKTYRTPFRRKRIHALRGVTFDVQPGEIFGFLGPNGAGKTTTIRTLMGLIHPTGGSAKIFGHTLPSQEARRRVGFLPEHPYFYDYLTVAELTDLAGRLCGVDRATRKKRGQELIKRVGLERAQGQNLKKFSKGMMQRAGLAQALMNDPDLVVLDEPTSGLDPIGRKEIRDLIIELRDQGKTVFFSSHILADVEAIADRVAIVARGQIQSVGKPSELVSRTVLGVDLTVRVPEDWTDDKAGPLTEGAISHRRHQRDLIVRMPPTVDADAWLAAARDRGCKVVSVVPYHESLEDLFLRQISTADSSTEATEGRV